MTIDDQIRDEKLQYNINREATKLSALSSNKFNKYEYLIDDKILPSAGKEMMQQAKFTYLPLGKPSEKQIKRTEDQGEKQIKAIQNQGDDEDTPLISKEKGMFNKLTDGRIDAITKLDEKFNLDNSIYRYKGKISMKKLWI